ncbi:MAG: RHS repeat-associated protein [Cyclobacteriaceae bacterium]|jgi:RHS repeat-associated protein
MLINIILPMMTEISFGAHNGQDNAYKVEGLSYDANGNIRSVKRFDSDPMEVLHDFTGAANSYVYYEGEDSSDPDDVIATNRLKEVPGYAAYRYDAIGQMTQQIKESSLFMDYDVSGKMTAVTLESGEEDARFTYDDRGFRMRKEDVTYGRESVYVRDASGTVLAIYEREGNNLVKKEVPVYGASRLGTYRTNGQLEYELKDHLGNVRATVTLGLSTPKYAADYYPFGLKRSHDGESYRYGYQGDFAEEDEETGFNHFELRDYDPVIGRWMNPDPARQHASPYLSFSNNPVVGVDPDGGWDIITIKSDGTYERQVTGSTDYYFYEDANCNKTFLGKFERNSDGMIELPENWSFDNGSISFSISAKQNRENFIGTMELAALLGAGVETGYQDISVTAYSLASGLSGPGHTTHTRGINGDLRYPNTAETGTPTWTTDYFLDVDRSTALIGAFKKYGYGSVLSMPMSNGNMLDGTTEHANHHHHFHIQNFRHRDINTVPTKPFQGLLPYLMGN